MGTLVKGYSAVYGNPDRSRVVTAGDRDILTPGGMIVAPGAFGGFLAANPGIQVPLLWYHNLKDFTAKQIGVTTDIWEDLAGLGFEGELADTVDGLDVAALLAQGDLGASLEFAGGSGDLDHSTGILTMHTAGFKEFSLLTRGHQANLLATAGLAETFQSDAGEVAGAIAAIREIFQAVA